MTMHVLDGIDALLDGELTAAEADGVRAHCATCARCAAALEEATRLRAVLRADDAEPPLRPMWPQIEERIHGGARADWRMLLGSGLAAAAGIALAFLLGTMGPTTPQATTDDAWASLGATVAGGPASAMSDIYLDTTVQEGVKTP